MPKVYTECDAEVNELMAATAEKWHPSLKKSGVTFCALFVEKYDGEGDCLEEACLDHHGYPAAAVIKVNSYKDRVEGKADATLLIDKFVWDDLTPPQKAALVDHELTHILVVEKDEVIKRDDLGRPVLKIKKHDWVAGGFDTMAKRHGDQALEVKAVMEINTRLRELQCNFG